MRGLNDMPPVGLALMKRRLEARIASTGWKWNPKISRQLDIVLLLLDEKAPGADRGGDQGKTSFSETCL